MTPSSNLLTAGEISLLDCLHDARDDLRELMQRWDNRLVFEGLSLPEEYAKGRLSIVCYVELGGRGDRVEPTAFSHKEGQILKPVVVIVMRAYSAELRDGNNRNEQPMLVYNVQLMEGPQRIIPSLVRLYDVKNQITDVLPRHLYFSTIQRAYKFLPRISYWKIGVPSTRATGFDDNLASHEIEGCAQIVDSIANYQGNIAGQGFRVEREDILPSSVRVYLQTVEVCFEEGNEGRVKLLDVAVGPFDLPMRAREG